MGGIELKPNYIQGFLYQQLGQLLQEPMLANQVFRFLVVGQ